MTLLAAAKIEERLFDILGREGVLLAPEEMAPFLVDHRRLYQGRARAVAAPRTVDEVSRLLAWCNAERIGVVPQGGNTGYCGGATPDESGKEIVLCLRRLARIRSVDAFNYSLLAEAGCTLHEVHAAADAAARLFPLSLGSEGSCQIGGNLSTNAGGTSVLRYGMMRDLVLGLEVVLADGRILPCAQALRKDNTGYDVKSLFVGAEGTLGIITAANLKLFPQIRASATAFVAVADIPSAVRLLSELRAASGERVSSFELIPRIAVELAAHHIPDVADPLEHAHPWYVLCELSSAQPEEALGAVLERALGDALERSVILDAAIAQSERQRLSLWRLRENIPEAQRRDGASLKHDLSLPISVLAQFVERAGAWLNANVPEGRLIAYGHLGDGNLHFNLNQAPGADRARFLARDAAVKRAVHDLVRDFGGSFSAEHGIGQLKVEELARYAPPVELDLMRAIKRALDPRGILNPGKVLGREDP
ncbi:MAG TPA: FAD-binding oxidoreductase [Steroidobacteraceae bacterium]|jgi:FAD/FMN-containing dehydrogenase|nr:FAD-binding oxidoreductase [Steroidobacteraceae bacterium]